MARGRSQKDKGSALIPFFVLLAWALLLASWVMGNAPFAAPDEVEHFIRAVGVSQGHVIGKADPNAGIGATVTQMSWTSQAARVVALPSNLNPEPYTCDLSLSEPSAACQNTVNPRSPPATLATAVGNYQLLPYLLPAVALRAAGSPPAALRLARAAQALVVLGLLAVALFALYDADSPLVSLLGLLLAVTPMVLFCGASLSGSGMEIASAIAFFSCLLRVGRDDPPRARWWLLTGLSGATLGLSRSASPAWLVLALLVAFGWCGPNVLARRWLSGLAPGIVAGVLVLAVFLNRIWEALYGARVSLDVSDLHAGLVAGAHEWWRSLPDLIGKFGYLDVKLPLIVPLAWFALVIALFASACLLCARRRRLLLALVFAVGLLGPTVFYALFIRPTGFGLQGRHVLPVLVVLPLLAGEGLYVNRASVAAERLRVPILTIPVACALMQLVAWYVNAKRYAVGGSGPEWFLGRAAWIPPAGWWTWLTTAVIASACLAGITLIGRGSDARPLQINYLTFPYPFRPRSSTMIDVTSRCPFGPVPPRGAGRPAHRR
jgi:Predicted membrane protein (DUF2142)